MDPKITCYCKKELPLGETEIYSNNPICTCYQIQCGNCLRNHVLQIYENRPKAPEAPEEGNKGNEG